MSDPVVSTIVTTIGEGLLRFSVPPGDRLESAEHYRVSVGGAELNVAAALAQLEIGTRWITALPDTPPGRRIAAAARAHGVDAAIAWRDSGRVGAYYYQPGTGGLPAHVTYDRAGSAFSVWTPDALPIAGRWLHLTGITAALSDTAYTLIDRTAAIARAAGMRISVDVNYRAALWSPERARERLLPIVHGVDLLLCARRDAALVFDLTGIAAEAAAGLAALTGARRVVVSAGDGGVIGWQGGTLINQPAVPVPVIDRVGAGDALAAGVLAGLVTGDDLERGLGLGVRLAALKLGQHGDMLTVRPADLDRVASGEIDR